MKNDKIEESHLQFFLFFLSIGFVFIWEVSQTMMFSLSFRGDFLKNFREDWRKSVCHFLFSKFHQECFWFLYFFSNKSFISLSPCENFLLNFLPVNFEKVFEIVVFLRFFLLTYQLYFGTNLCLFSCLSINILFILKNWWFCEWGDNVTSLKKLFTIEVEEKIILRISYMVNMNERL